MNLVRLGNKYLTDKEPWKKFESDKEATGHILNFTLQLISNASILLNPFLPLSSKRIANMLALPENLTWKDAGNYKILSGGHKLGKPEILFTKIEDSEIQRQIDKLHNRKKEMDAKQADAKPATKPTITYDDFAKLELRIGTIETAEKVKNADKLLVLKVNMGDEVRTIVSGIAMSYQPENIIGQQVCVVCNLAPRKIKGIESKGMILMAEDKDGVLHFIMPSQPVSNGSSVS
jgi:methionyl-tRNA synthetase